MNLSTVNNANTAHAPFNADLAPALYIPSFMVLDLPETQTAPVRSEHTLHFATGEIIREAGATLSQSYVITNGEVIILRNGVPVDLLEAGEILDDFCWEGATAVAHADCALSIVDEQADDVELINNDEFDMDGSRQLLRAIMGPLAYQ